MTSETLENAGVNDILALERVAPSFNINTSDSATGGVVLRVRGVGTTGNNIGFESSVGVFVDGFYRPRPGGVLGDLVDIERIELLRGSSLLSLLLLLLPFRIILLEGQCF